MELGAKVKVNIPSDFIEGCVTCQYEIMPTGFRKSKSSPSRKPYNWTDVPKILHKVTVKGLHLNFNLSDDKYIYIFYLSSTNWDMAL